jgi:hypothetical protein
MEIEFIEGTWKHPFIYIEKWKGADPASFYPNSNHVTFGPTKWCNEEDITYLLNHELDHWAQRNGEEFAFRFVEDTPHITHILERCNAFSQMDNITLWEKSKLHRER